jgi:predicted hotdog family 3-hydroxylacyl-ACP dehydratase
VSDALGRDWIASHLPHRGPMNLLDAIVAWDGNRLHGRAVSHRDPANPLRRGAELPIACGIEYGAQAVAAHGVLAAEGAGADAVADAGAASGFLASVRSVEFHAGRLDDVADPLDIHVERIGGGAGGLLYRFRLSAGGRLLLAGRLAIVLGGAAFPRA